MPEAIMQNPIVVNRTSARGLFLKARAMIRKDDSRRYFERAFNELDSAKGLVILDFDGFNRISGKSEGGWGGQNAMAGIPVNGDLYFPLIPHNDGGPTCPFVFYRKDEAGKFAEIMDNQMDFTEIKNLAQVLVNVARIMHEAYRKRIPVHPFQSFMIGLPRDATKETINLAKLGMCIPDIGIKDMEKWLALSQNSFLDHFIGWNFGDIARGSEELETLVLDYHRMMIRDGRRKDAGPGFEVTYRTSDTSIDNHYCFLFPGMEIDPLYLFDTETMKGIKDRQSYMEEIAQKYGVTLAEVETAMNMMDRYVLHCIGMPMTDNDHPEPFEGSLGWLHTPRGACNICPTIEGYRMLNGLRLLEGRDPIAQMGKLDMDRDAI